MAAPNGKLTIQGVEQVFTGKFDSLVKFAGESLAGKVKNWSISLEPEKDAMRVIEAINRLGVKALLNTLEME